MKVQARDRLLRATCWAIPALLAALLVLPGLGSLIGLHGDEAWVLGRIRQLARGGRPLDGMTFYTGPLHQYLSWPFVRALASPGRAGVFALRLPGALLNVAAVALVAVTVRRRFGPRVALATGLLLATSPVLVAYARFGIEIAALSPFLCAAAFAAISAAAERSGRAALGFAALAGVALGAAAYNHVVLAPVPIVLALGAAWATRGRALARPTTYAVLAGFALATAPRIARLFTRAGQAQWLSRDRGESFWPDLPHLPGILARAWDGTLVYKRFVGEVVWPVLPYPLVACALLLVLRARTGRALPSRLGTVAGVGVLAVAVGMTAMAAHISLRYYQTVVLAFAVLLGIGAAPVLASDRSGLRRAGIATVGAVVGLNLVYLGGNYFAPLAREGTRLGVFPLGARLVETSNHFVRTDRLHEALLARGVRRVDAEYFIALPLVAHDGVGVLEWGPADPSEQDPKRPRIPTAVIFYDGPQPNHAQTDAFDGRTMGATVDRGGIEFRHDDRFPAPFRVYLAEPPPASR